MRPHAGDKMQPCATHCTVDEAVSEHRRGRIIAGLLKGRLRKDIAKDVGVSRWTLSRWLENDERLIEGLQKASATLYEDAIDEIRSIAFSEAEPSATTKLAALKLIKDEHESRLRDSSENMTPLDVQRLLSKVVSVLEGFPDARAAVISALENERQSHLRADGLSSDFSEEDDDGHARA